MHYSDALQLKALRGIIHPTNEDFWYHVRRFYSRTFHTPLPDVDDLSEEEVLRAYYTESFEAMSEDDRYEYLAKLCETKEERQKREAQEKQIESADAKAYDRLNQEVAAGLRKGPPKEIRKIKKKNQPPNRPPSTPVDEIHMTFGPNLADNIGQT